MGGFREASNPETRAFRLSLLPIESLGMFVAVVFAAASVFSLSSGLAICLFPSGLGLFTAIGYVASGGPRLLEVLPDRVRIHYLLRQPRELPAQRLRLQQYGEELILVTDEHTVSLSADRFVDRAQPEAAAALEAMIRATGRDSVWRGKPAR